MDISIYQIKYSDAIASHQFDPAFIQYDCRHNPQQEKREIAHMLDLYASNPWVNQPDQYIGMVSPKFCQKTGLLGKQWLDWIKANPGYDVYFINPYPVLSYVFYNVWTQGELKYPGLMQLSQALFQTAHYPVDIFSLPRNTLDTASYCNFWVGNKNFWDRYMQVVVPLNDCIDQSEQVQQSFLYDKIIYKNTAMSIYPFVFERIFSTLLLTQNINFLAYPYDTEGIVNQTKSNPEYLTLLKYWGGVVDAMDGQNIDPSLHRTIFKKLAAFVIASFHHSDDNANAIVNAHKDLIQLCEPLLLSP